MSAQDLGGYLGAPGVSDLSRRQALPGGIFSADSEFPLFTFHIKIMNSGLSSCPTCHPLSPPVVVSWRSKLLLLLYFGRIYRAGPGPLSGVSAVRIAPPLLTRGVAGDSIVLLLIVTWVLGQKVVLCFGLLGQEDRGIHRDELGPEGPLDYG